MKYRPLIALIACLTVMAGAAQAAPVATFDSLSPNPVEGCGDLAVGLSVFNDDGAASIYDTSLMVTVPADFYFISADSGGVYDSGAHTITWDLGEVVSLATESVTLRLRPACSASSGQTLSARVEYRAFSGEPDPKHVEGPVSSAAIAINSPALSVTLEEFNTGAQVVWGESGQTVEYRLTVENSGAAPVSGVDTGFTFESGLSLVAVKNDTAAGTNVAYALAGSTASWTTGPIAPGGQEVFYVRVSTLACANLNATADISWGCADDGGAPSCALTDQDSVLTRCPLTFTVSDTLPEGGGTYVNSCQEFDLDVDLSNNDENALNSVAAVVTIPDDYFYVSSTPAGTYDDGTHTISFNVGTIAGFGTQNLALTLRPSCDTGSRQQVAVEVDYESPVQTVNLPRSDYIDVRTPVVNVSLEDDNNPGSTVIEASRGDTVTFRMNVINSGSGDLVDGADLEFSAGAGFSSPPLFLDASDVPLSPQPTWNGSQWVWNSGRLDSATTTVFKIRMQVIDCENLTNGANFYWGCADDGGAPSCSKTNGANSSIKIILKTPLLDLTVPGISVDWCAGDTVTIPVANNGTGPARNVRVDVTGLDLTNLEVAVNPASDFSFVQNGSVAEFWLISGDDTDSDTNTDDMVSGSTYNIDFTLRVRTGGAGCGAGGGGSLLYAPVYQDDCDTEFTAGTDVGSYSVGARPRVTISKTGPIFADTNDTLTWSFTLTNTHTAPITAEVVDQYPDMGDTPNGWGNFTVSDADGGTDDGDRVTFTVANGNAIVVPAGGSVTKNLVFFTPSETCAGGQTYTNQVTMTFAELDCNGCAIPGNGASDSVSVYINNDQENMLNGHNRTVAYTNYNTNHRLVAAAQGETCSIIEDGAGNPLIHGGVTYTASIDFNTAGVVPATWDDTDGAGNNISFTEHLDNNLQIPGPAGDPLADRLDLSVTYDGTDITSEVSVTDNGGSFTIDFGSVDEAVYGRPNDGDLLLVTYTLYAPDAASGSFISHHTLTVPNSGDACLSPTPEDFDQGVITTISRSGAGVGVSKLTAPTNFVDRCETATYRITVTPDQPWTVYDARVELDLNGRYEWNPASIVTFTGFTDENGAAIASVPTTQVGDILRWDFGDLNSGGTIELILTKRCTDASTTLSATVFTNTNCDNVADGSSYGTDTGSGSWTAALLRGGEMEVVLTPETYYVKTGYPVMRFYVVNSGNGRLFDLEVPVVLGNELEYLDNTPTLPAGTTLTGVNVVDPQHVTFSFDQLDPGEQLYVEFEMRALGCSDIGVNVVDATWGCYGQTIACDPNLPVSDSANVILADTDVIVTEHSATPDFLDLCGAPSTFVVRIANKGISEVYEAIGREDLPPGLTLFGTPQYRIDEDGDGTWDGPLQNFPEAGGVTHYNAATGVMEWNFMDPDDDGDQSDSLVTTTDGHEADLDGLRHFVLKPGAEIYITFQAHIADCADADAYVLSDRKARAEVDFDRPCDHANLGDPLTTAGLNVVVELPTQGNVDILKQGQNPSGAPWDATWTSGEVRAESGQTVNWKITLTSNGDGRAAGVYLEDTLPDNTAFSSWANLPAESTPGIVLDYLSGDGTAGNPLRFVVDNGQADDPATPADESTYLDDGEFVTIQVQTTVTSCDTLKTNVGTVSWGCCSPGAPSQAHGDHTAAVDLRTRPDQEPVVTLAELPGSEFAGCNGVFRLTVENPNADYSFYGFDLQLPVPGDYAYDDSTATLGTQFSYAGNAGRAVLTLTEAEEEPVESGGVLHWTGAADGGNIADARAVVLPGETVTVDVIFHADCGAVNDPGPANDGMNPYDVGSLPSFNETFTADFDDSCGTVALNDSVQINVNPEQADIDVTTLSAVPTLGHPGDTITWTITLTNRGDLTADDLAMQVVFGNGYQNVTRLGGGGAAHDSLVGNTVTWNQGTFTVAPSGTATWTYQAEILAGSGDLSVTVDVDGHCVNLNAVNTCQYTNDQRVQVLAGAVVEKTIISVNEPAAVTNPGTDTAADAAHGSLITYRLVARFQEDGPFTNVSFTDTLPAGLTYVSATIAPDAVNVAGTDTILEWNPTGGAGTVNGVQVFTVDVSCLVADTTAKDAVLTNTAELGFTHFGTNYSGSTHPSDLQKTNAVTVKIPEFVNDADYSKTATPASGSTVVGGDTIDYVFSARNTGNSPAFDTVFADLLPTGMRGSAPANITVGVDTDGDRTPERVLVSATDYVTAWNAGTGIFTVTLQNTNDARILPTEALIVAYRGTLDGGVAIHSSFQNAAEIDTFTSLPAAGQAGEVDKTYSGPGTVSTTHQTPGPEPAKSVTMRQTGPAVDPVEVSDASGRATIGERVKYITRLVLPQFTSAYDVEFSDTIADGLTPYDDGAAPHECGWTYNDPATGAPVTGNLSITNNGDGSYTLSGTIGDVYASAVTGNNTIEVWVTATVDKSYEGAAGPGATDANGNGTVDQGDSLENLAAITFNRVDDDAGTSLSLDTNSGTPLVFTVVEPHLANLAKSFDASSGDLFDQDAVTAVNRGTDTFVHYDTGSLVEETGVDVVLPEDYLRFTVTVRNTGGAAAHEIVFKDTLPAELTYNATDIAAVSATASDGDNPSVTVNGVSPLNVTFSHLNAGQTLTVVYYARVNQAVGAGRYFRNSAEILDYSTLDDTLTDPAPVPAIALRERSTSAGAPADPGVFADLGPVAEEAGIMRPTLAKNQYRLYDENGDLLGAPILMNATADRKTRIGEIIRYEVVVTLPRYTVLYDGGADHVIVMDRLPLGYERLAGTDDYATGDIDLTPVLGSLTGPGGGTREIWYYRFADTANPDNASRTAAITFDVQVTQDDNQGNPLFEDPSVEVNSTSLTRLFWDTTEAVAEPGTANWTTDRPREQVYRRSDVQQPLLTLDKTSDQPAGTPVNASEDVVYTVALANQNAFDWGYAYDLTLEDVLPVGMRAATPVILSVEVQGGTPRTLVAGEDYTDNLSAYNPATGQIQVVTHYDAVNGDYDGRVGRGETLVVTYRAFVDATVGAGTLINEAKVTGHYSLPAGVNDGERKVYTVDADQVVLNTEPTTVVKTAVPVSGSSVQVGDTITYTLLIPNPGINATMYDLEIVDTLPDGLSVADPQPGNLAAGDVQVSGGVGAAITPPTGPRNRDIVITATSLPSTQQITVTITAQVEADFEAGGVIPFFHEFENFATAYWYNQPADPRTRYNAVSNRVVHSLMPRGILFEPDHTEDGEPGAVKWYRHVLRNNAESADNVTLTYGPSTEGWEWILYEGDGEGNVVGGPILSGGAVALGAGASKEILARGHIPTDVPEYTTDVLTISAAGATNTVEVTDVTMVRKARMAIEKDARTTAGAWGTVVDVERGEEVFQRLTFYVNGAEAVQNVYVYDFIPENTTYVRGSATDDNAAAPAVNDPDLKVSYSTQGGADGTWVDGEPATDAVAAKVTNLRWQYVGGTPAGQLEPGIKKEIVFKVTVD